LKTYILIDHQPIRASMAVWTEWFNQDSNVRVVDRTDTPYGYVSTVFLGIGYNHGSTGDPVLFETMVFGGEHAGRMKRYSTWKEAEDGHAAMLAYIASPAGNDGGISMAIPEG
jgi:hypothetical protein